jgi:ribosome-associated heat shock protein Hsp15
VTGEERLAIGQQARRVPDAGTVRLDKWLWAARFFKTRSLAQLAVDSGRVKLNGERAKPARALKVGDRIEVHLGDDVWILTVRGLANQRGSAPVAQQLYGEDESSRRKRQERAARRRLAPDPSVALQGRPTKRDRRRIEQFTEGE